MAGEIRKTIVIDAPPETVFRAISDEKELTQWFPDQAKIEPKVDRFLQFKFYEDGKENHRVEGKVLEIIPNKKISYSWVNKSDPKLSKYGGHLDAVDGNKTKVTLVHTGFDPKSRWYDLHSKGWSYFIEDSLVAYCSKKKE